MGGHDPKGELSRCSRLIIRDSTVFFKLNWEGQSRRDANRPGRGSEKPVETSAEERDGVIWDPIRDYHQGQRPSRSHTKAGTWLQPTHLAETSRKSLPRGRPHMVSSPRSNARRFEVEHGHYANRIPTTPATPPFALIRWSTARLDSSGLNDFGTRNKIRHWQHPALKALGSVGYRSCNTEIVSLPLEYQPISTRRKHEIVILRSNQKHFWVFPYGRDPKFVRDAANRPLVIDGSDACLALCGECHSLLDLCNDSNRHPVGCGSCHVTAINNKYDFSFWKDNAARAFDQGRHKNLLVRYPSRQ